MGPNPRDTHGSSIILGGVGRWDGKTGQSASTPCQCGESSGRDWTGAARSCGTSAPETHRLGCAAGLLRGQEESSRSRRSIVMAALLAQERLTVFCIYLLVFHHFFKKRMLSRSPGISFWNMCVQQSVSLHPLSLKRHMFPQGAGQRQASPTRPLLQG